MKWHDSSKFRWILLPKPPKETNAGISQKA